MVRKTKKAFFHTGQLPLKKRIGLTTGDEEGVGRWVCEKSLEKLGVQKNHQFMVWTSPRKRSLKVRGFKTKIFKKGEEALRSPFCPRELLEIKSKNSPGDWVEEASLMNLKGNLSALVTGPISKGIMKKNKFKGMGHTDFFRKLCKTENIFMVFFGKHFNLILLTDHIPLNKVKIEKKRLRILFLKALELRLALKPSLQKKPLALLGLNPHAGEGGLLGKEEMQVLKPLLKEFKGRIKGPFPPDSAFLKKNWKEWSFYISLYHDQGLPVFKTVHEQGGFTFSLGLPFIRTGVDHGTGKGLQSSEIKFESFFLALKKAISFTRKCS